MLALSEKHYFWTNLFHLDYHRWCTLPLIFFWTNQFHLNPPSYLCWSPSYLCPSNREQLSLSIIIAHDWHRAAVQRTRLCIRISVWEDEIENQNQDQKKKSEDQNGDQEKMRISDSESEDQPSWRGKGQRENKLEMKTNPDNTYQANAGVIHSPHPHVWCSCVV